MPFRVIQPAELSLGWKQQSLGTVGLSVHTHASPAALLGLKMTVLVMNSRLLPFCLWTTGAKQTGTCKDLATYNLLQYEAAKIHMAVCMGATH